MTLPCHARLRRWSLAVLATLALAACSGGGPAAAGDDLDDDSSGDGGSSGAGGGPSAGNGAGTSTGAGGDGEPAFVPCPYPDFAARFEESRAALAADLAANGVKGGAFAIVCESEILSAGIGVVREAGPAVASTTRFQLASMTKMLTATATLALVEQGIVDLDAPLAAVMPELGYGDQVTLAHLLSHTSGLPVEFPQYPSEALIPLVLGNPNLTPATTPGSAWEYNNIGYAIIGAVLETASGVAFDALVHEHVLSPIAMATATMRVGEVLSGGDFAYGHSGSTELGPEDSYYGAPWYGPMGGAWASADDVARYARSLLGHGPLAERLAQQMIPRTPTGEWAGAQYGYGLFIDEGVSPTMIFHSGSVQGFLCDMEVVPDAGIATVILVNDDEHLPLDVAFAAIEKFVPLSYRAGSTGSEPHVLRPHHVANHLVVLEQSFVERDHGAAHRGGRP